MAKVQVTSWGIATYENAFREGGGIQPACFVRQFFCSGKLVEPSFSFVWNRLLIILLLMAIVFTQGLLKGFAYSGL